MTSKPRRERPWDQRQVNAQRGRLLDHLYRVGMPDPAEPSKMRRFTVVELAALFRCDRSWVCRELARHTALMGAMRRATE